MRTVPSLPPPISIPEEGPEVKALGSSRAARRVTEPAKPPRVVNRYGGGGANAEESGDEHQRSGEDRRKLCRRIDKDASPLMDTRADRDRRHRNRRQEDIKTNVEEKA